MVGILDSFLLGWPIETGGISLFLLQIQRIVVVRVLLGGSASKRCFLLKILVGEWVDEYDMI